MKRTQIEHAVTSFIRDTFLFDVEATLDPKQSLIGTGVVDSTGTLELIGFLEREFDVTFADAELVGENFESIEKIATFLEAKLTASDRKPTAPMLALVGEKEREIAA